MSDSEDERDHRTEEEIEELNKKRAIIQNKEIVFNEYLINSDFEQIEVTRNYLKQIKKMDVELAGGKEKFREYHRSRAKIVAKQKERLLQIQQQIEYSDSDNDEDGELVDQLFAVTNYGHSEEEKKRVE